MHKRISHAAPRRALPWLLVFVAGIIFGPMVIRSAATLLEPAPAIASSPEQESPDGTTAQASHECNIEMVATYPGMVGVNCGIPVNNITWFASSNSNAQQAARILSTALTAHAADKKVLIYYETATTNLPADCNPIRCRAIIALHMLD